MRASLPAFACLLFGADLVVEGIRHAAKDWPEVGSVVTTSDCTQLLALYRRHAPDIMAIDWDSIAPDRIGLMEELSRETACAIILLAQTANDVLLYQIRLPAIRGLICGRDRHLADVRTTLLSVAAGDAALPAPILSAARFFRQSPTAFFKILSKTEIKLMPYFARAQSDLAIGVQLQRSPQTIHFHRQHVMSSLNLHRTQDLIHWANEAGF